MSHPITFVSTIPNPFQSNSFPEDEVEAIVTAQIGYDEGETLEGRVVVAPSLWAEIREVLTQDPNRKSYKDPVEIDVRSQLSEATIETLEAEALAEDGARADSGDPHEDDPGF